MKKISILKKIILELIPILIMIALIPFFKEIILVILFIIIILIAFKIKYQKKEVVVFLLGLIAMTMIELIFISTGIETFAHNKLFGIPLWLPLIWGYGFVVIKRIIQLIK